MAQAQSGDTVRVHYTGTFDDGTVFDSSKGKDPLEFTIGEHQVIPGFEEGVVGMDVAETKTINISAENAYGPRDDRMILELSRDQLPEDFQPEMGQALQLAREDGQTILVRVVALTDDSVKLDANHPLAGRDLTFEIELLQIV